VLFGLEFTDNVDPTAVATLALALMTFGLVLVTMWSLRQTREEVELSRREVEEAHRPVLVPIIDATRKMKPDRPDSPSVGPQLMSQGVLWVPLENIGSGPALDIEVSLQLTDLAEVSGDRTAGALAGLGADRLLPVAIHDERLTKVSDFKITITYEDVAGKKWRTRAGYAASRGRYEGILIDYHDAATG
jgi:hypothetical protein